MPSSLEKYELVKGGRISDEGIPGCLSVTPSQIGFYEKERLLDMQLVYKAPAISKDLDDAIIAQVTLNVPYLNIGSSGLGLGESQVKVKTNLRVAQQLTCSMKKEEKLLRIGKNDVVTVDSKVSFVMGKRGLAAEAQYYGYLGKDLTIEGVMDNQTIKAVSRTTSLGTQVHTAGSLVFYSYQNESDIEIKNLEVDADKYEKGVNKGLSALLMAYTDGFLNSY
jgi:hypothetical protein